MQRLKFVVFSIVLFAVTGLANYELAAKSSGWIGLPWPGWHKTLQIERRTPMVHWTGMRPVDRLLHEGQEALSYYRDLLS